MSKEIDLNESNKNQLYLLYKEEFINYCENILIENQNEFLDKFYAKMDLIIKNNYGENIFDKITSLYLTKKQCENKFITDIYWPMHDLCLNTKNNFYSNNNNNNKINYLINFRPHCLFDQVPLHTCGSKFIQVFDNDKENKIIYVICTGCDKCYYSNCIIMNCHYCQIDFYSEVKNIKNNLFYATWKKYHCNNDKLLINEKMHCIICNNLLYIKNNKLFCKICKEYFDPDEIIWTCKVCNTEFKSDIKIFNPYEFKEIEIIKKEAFLYKKISKPNYLPCNCVSKNNINNTNFYHEPDGNCKGFMYYCYVNNKEFLVCSLCNSIFELNKFCWKCPICYKKFIVNELQFEDNNKEKSNNYLFQKINKKDIIEQPKKIHNSCSQKIIDNDKKDFIKNNKIHKNENNSYVKKRINSSFIKSNNNNLNTSIKINKNNNLYPMNKRKSLLTNNNILNNNSSNKEINSFHNKYNMTSTMYSSFMNNNIKDPQTERNTAYSFIVPKNEKTAEQNKYKINNYINKKILNNQSSNINNKTVTNRKMYLKSKYKSIMQYINDFNYVDKTNNNYIDVTNKSINIENNNENNKEEFIKKIKKGFTKYKKNNHKEKSFCISNKNNNNKSFISQKSDDKNQIYVPKKHFINHCSSLPSIEKNFLCGSNQKNNYIKYNNSCEKRRIINNDLLNGNDLLKHKLNSDVKKLSIDKNNNYIDDIMQKKFKDGKRNHKNTFQILTENNKGTLISTIEDQNNKNIVNNNISFKKYMKNNYKKSFKDKKGINKKLRLNLVEINNNNHNKNNIKKRNNKNEYLTSFNNHCENNNNNNNAKNKQKIKKENNLNKNNNSINKKMQTSHTKSGLVKGSKIRNTKRCGLIDIISNFNQIKNSIEQEKKSKDKKINKHNLNITYTENNFNKAKNESKENQKNITLTQEINPDKDNDELKIFNFEEYKIITQLGQGSFGKIYLVQNSNNELFTMKKLVYSEELDVQAVIKEYKMCYKLKHPNVVKILGIYSKKLDKTTYVVYVLMEVGMTDWEKEIKKHIEKNIYYTENELIHIIKQLSAVFSFLQKSNISHRDIKPQNILVFKNNIYKIADFGEAKQIDNLTINLISNSLRGTELYMSPLLFNGLRNGQIDIKHNVFKSDVYSFGLCILFASSLQMISIYDIRKIIDMNDVNKYLEKILGNKYSKKFVELLGTMLEIHEKNRPDFIMLEDILKDWDINA